MQEIKSRIRESTMKKESLELKVCGNKFPDNYTKIDDVGVDYMGFIFHSPSQRNVNWEELRQQDEFHALHSKKMAVTVNADISLFEKISPYFDSFQLHGYESANYCAHIKSQFPNRLVKVFSVDEHFNFHFLQYYLDVVDAFLFDTKGKNFGGNGFAFDWKKLEEYTYDIPFYLSGGIVLGDAERIKNLKFKNLIGIDINSKFEDAPALKNIALVENFKKELACKTQ